MGVPMQDDQSTYTEHLDGSKAWRRDAALHREDGPALIKPDGTQEWYIGGTQLTHVEFALWQDAQRRQAGFNAASGMQKTDHPVAAPATARFRRPNQPR